MSLISDALKRQEQLRAPGKVAAQREDAAARPPEVAATESPEVTAARPPEASPRQRPNLATSATQPRRVSGPTSRGNAAPASNPFLERERAASRRSAHPAFLMPIVGLLVFLALLFLRRELIPSDSPTAQVEDRRSKVEGLGGSGIVPADAAVLSDLFPEEAESPEGLGTAPVATPAASRQPEAESPGGPGAVPAGTPAGNSGGPGIVPAATPVNTQKAESLMAIDGNRTQSTAVEVSLSTNTATLSAAEAMSPQPPKTWPAFALTGIAVGRERIAVLSTGEMLIAGETAKCGVKVEKVNGATVVFTWGGETKTLRKGEHSDKPADGN